MWLKTVIGWLGSGLGLDFSKWAGIGTLVLGFVVGSSALAGWLRDDALKDCNQAWELKLSQANGALQKQLAEKQMRITALEARVVEAEASQTILALKAKEELEKQREQVKLSEDCSKCRVPNERIWVRRPAGNPAGASSRAQGNEASARP